MNTQSTEATTENKVVAFFTHQRTAILGITVAVLYSLIDQLNAGRFNWKDTLGAALVALVGIAKSAIGK